MLRFEDEPAAAQQLQGTVVEIESWVEVDQVEPAGGRKAAAHCCSTVRDVS